MRTLLVPLLLAVLLASPAPAAEWIVALDGTGDFDSLGAAVAGAADGDLLRLKAGHYFEYVEIEKSLTLETFDGTRSVILDGGGANRIMNISGPATLVLRDLTWANAYGAGPSALMIWNQADVTLERCVFRDNETLGSNAVHVRHAGTRAVFEGCLFSKNTATVHSGALSLSHDAYVLLSDCHVIFNSSEGSSGAVNVQEATLDLSDCVFIGNSSPNGAGALHYFNAQGKVARCTFHRNSGYMGSVRLDETTFVGNIVSGNPSGPGLLTTWYATFHSNLYFDNAQGSIIGGDLQESDLQADPQYCDPWLDDLHLCDSSPALAVFNGVADMGALGVGCPACGPVPNEDRTWGEVKTLYR